MYPEISGYCETDRMFLPTKKIAVICPETRASYQRGMNSAFSSSFWKSTYCQDSICALNEIQPFPRRGGRGKSWGSEGGSDDPNCVLP